MKLLYILAFLASFLVNTNSFAEPYNQFDPQYNQYLQGSGRKPIGAQSPVMQNAPDMNGSYVPQTAYIPPYTPVYSPAPQAQQMQYQPYQPQVQATQQMVDPAYATGSQVQTQYQQYNPNSQMPYDPNAYNMQPGGGQYDPNSQAQYAYGNDPMSPQDEFGEGSDSAFRNLMKKYYVLEVGQPFSAKYERATRLFTESFSSTALLPIVSKRGSAAAYVGYRFSKISDNFRGEFGVSYDGMYLDYNQNERAFHVIDPGIRMFWDIAPRMPISGYIGLGLGLAVVDQVYGSEYSVKTAMKTDFMFGVNIVSNMNRDIYIGYKSSSIANTTFDLAASPDFGIKLSYQSISIGVKLRSI